jgi:preprotein translocase subunit SecG
MYRVLIIFLLLDAFVLMSAVLLQSGKGGGLAASFGGASSGDALFGARQAGNLLTKVTWWCAGIFIGLAFMMQLMTSRTSGPRSVLDQSFTPPPARTTPAATPNANAPTVPLQALPAAPPAGDAKKADAGTKQPDATKKQPDPAKKP